jgi:hypothetical protein
MSTFGSNRPDGLFAKIEKEPFDTCIYEKVFLDYTYGLNIRFCSRSTMTPYELLTVDRMNHNLVRNLLINFCLRILNNLNQFGRVTEEFIYRELNIQFGSSKRMRVCGG